MRPDIVWFGEALDETVLSEACRLATAAQLCLVIGTSAVVYPAAGLAKLTLRGGGTVIEVNVDATPLTDIATFSLRGPAAEIVPRLLGETQSAT
jgi:NAD-dependent deacetylase